MLLSKTQPKRITTSLSPACSGDLHACSMSLGTGFLHLLASRTLRVESQMLYLLGFNFACEQWSPKPKLQKKVHRSLPSKLCARSTQLHMHMACSDEVMIS